MKLERSLYPRSIGFDVAKASLEIDDSVVANPRQMRLKLATPKSDDQERHAAMARRRKQLLHMINQERNRLLQTADPVVGKLFERT